MMAIPLTSAKTEGSSAKSFIAESIEKKFAEMKFPDLFLIAAALRLFWPAIRGCPPMAME